MSDFEVLKTKRTVKVYAKHDEKKSVYCGRKLKPKTNSEKTKHEKVFVDKKPSKPNSTVLKECLSILRARYSPIVKASELAVEYCKEFNKPTPRNEFIADFFVDVFRSNTCKVLNQNNKTRYKKPRRKVKESFYMTDQWRSLRKQVLKKYGSVCMKCQSKKQIHIDHIKPRSLFPELELDFDNLQVLCKTCNERKSNIHFKDYRPS
jgi:5-methylcytosine-specific restriction endonuclease McrA